MMSASGVHQRSTRQKERRTKSCSFTQENEWRGWGDPIQREERRDFLSVSDQSQEFTSIRTLALKRKSDQEESDQPLKKSKSHHKVVGQEPLTPGFFMPLSSAPGQSITSGGGNIHAAQNISRKRKRDHEDGQPLQKTLKLDQEDARRGSEDSLSSKLTVFKTVSPKQSMSIFKGEADSWRNTESNILRESKKRKSPCQLDSVPQMKIRKMSTQSPQPLHPCDKPEHDCSDLPYIQGKLLGQGGFGSVYAGNRTSDGLKVAIKYVSKDLLDEQLEVEGQGLMPIEVALMIRVNSDPVCPNILHLIEWFETPTQYIMILERPDPCQDLDKFCEEQGEVDENLAKGILVQLIRALIDCKRKGVLHRDVKPQNILIRTDTHDIKLLDFGCGDLWKDSDYKMFAGTKQYFPPEWYTHRRYRAGPSTVWSVGVTLYYILCGMLPFKTRKDIIRCRLRFTRDLSAGMIEQTFNRPLGRYHT